MDLVGVGTFIYFAVHLSGVFGLKEIELISKMVNASL